MENAPFYEGIAGGPDGGAAFWKHASDGVRLRLGLWQAGQGKNHEGTVLLFPGRTEYIEKYGTTAKDLAKMGFATLTIDWRGQGLADRVCENQMIGHVLDFPEYQLDLAAMLEAANQLNLPRPFYLLAHSMGGCIGLRALHEGLEVKAAVFSAPMWGISIAPHMRPLAWVASWLSHHGGKGCKLAPGTEIETYVENAPFADNELTKDPDMFSMMQRQAKAQPDLTLGGPSMSWLYAALTETRALARLPAPSCPCVTFLGTDERIVDPRPIHKQMAGWETGELVIVEGSEHEVLMEVPQTRTNVNTRMQTLFSQHR